MQRDSVSAELLNQNVVATNFVAGCQEVGLAEAALQALSDEGIRLGESVPQDSAARQEGSLVRVRQIIEFDQIGVSLILLAALEALSPKD